MQKKLVKYTDFNGQERAETLYFNLSEAEVVRLEVSFNAQGGMEKYISELNEKERPEEILELFERMLCLAYGEKSEDGRYFEKSEEMTKKFRNSAAYSALFMELISDAEVAGAFFGQMLSRTAVPSTN